MSQLIPQRCARSTPLPGKFCLVKLGWFGAILLIWIRAQKLYIPFTNVWFTCNPVKIRPLRINRVLTVSIISLHIKRVKQIKSKRVLFADYSWCYYDKHYSWQYRYTLNVTQSGVPCTSWWDMVEAILPESLPPSSRIFNDSFYPDGSIRHARNYCRNPDTEPYQIWCFIGLKDEMRLYEFCSSAGCPNLGRNVHHHAQLVQYIPRNMHTVFALLCFVVVIHWPIFLYPSGLLHWHCGNLTIAPVPAKQPWWIWINISRGFIMNDCITTKQSTTKPCAYFLGYTVVCISITAFGVAKHYIKDYVLIVL